MGKSNQCAKIIIRIFPFTGARQNRIQKNHSPILIVLFVLNKQNSLKNKMHKMFKSVKTSKAVSQHFRIKDPNIYMYLGITMLYVVVSLQIDAIHFFFLKSIK